MSIFEIQAKVCEHYEITRDQMLSRRRSMEFVTPRFMAIYLAHHLTDSSTVKLGREFHRDHTAIMNALKQAEKMLLDEDFAEALGQIKQDLVYG